MFLRSQELERFFLDGFLKGDLKIQFGVKELSSRFYTII